MSRPARPPGTASVPMPNGNASRPNPRSTGRCSAGRAPWCCAPPISRRPCARPRAMKAADFDYVCPASLDEVCQQLESAAGDAKVLAGGQTLVPLLAMRLTRPALLVDINNVVELRGIREDDDALVIGSATRQATAEHSALVHKALPLLIKGLRNVGHIQTRNRGTVGGSVANADRKRVVWGKSVSFRVDLGGRSRYKK